MTIVGVIGRVLLGIYFLQIALTRYVYFPYCRLV